MPCYFNIYEYGGNIFKRLYVAYEQAYMATTKDKYYKNMLEALVDYNDCNNAPFFNENLQQSISKVIAETKEEERDARRNANNVTTDNFFHQPPSRPIHKKILQTWQTRCKFI